MELRDLTPNPNNPRKISEERLTNLEKSLRLLGPLDGIIFNRRFQRLVGAHQRRKILPPDSKITIFREYSEPTESGTVRIGYCEAWGELYPYREVDVDEPTERLMNVSANAHGGAFDMTIIVDWMNDFDAMNVDLDLTGFDQKQREDMMAPVDPHPPVPSQEPKSVKCPNCAHEFDVPKG